MRWWRRKKQQQLGPDLVAWWVGPYMHEGQSSDPQHPHKEMPMAMAAPVIPELRRQEKGSLSSLAC